MNYFSEELKNDLKPEEGKYSRLHNVDQKGVDVVVPVPCYRASREGVENPIVRQEIYVNALVEYLDIARLDPASREKLFYHIKAYEQYNDSVLTKGELAQSNIDQEKFNSIKFESFIMKKLRGKM